jgi:hypothetical protein
MRPIRVVVESQFVTESSEGRLAAMGDALMEALIDAWATDPFVSIDRGRHSLLVEVVVQGENQPNALAGGAALIDAALRAAGVEQTVALHRSKARAEDLVPG